MSNGPDALYDFAAHDPRRFTPSTMIPERKRARPQNAVGGAALAFIAATSLWTVEMDPESRSTALLQRIAPTRLRRGPTPRDAA